MNEEQAFHTFERQIIEFFTFYEGKISPLMLNHSFNMLDGAANLVFTQPRRLEEDLSRETKTARVRRINTFENMKVFFNTFLQFNSRLDLIEQQIMNSNLTNNRKNTLFFHIVMALRDTMSFNNLEALEEYVIGVQNRMEDLNSVINKLNLFEVGRINPHEGAGRRKKRGGFIIPSLNPLQSYYDAAKFAYNYATGTRTYSKKVQDFFKKHGEERIVGLEIEREPVQAAIPTLLSWLSGGKFKENVKKADYDKLFHLSINITTENGTFFKIEKNEEIAISNSKRNTSGAEFVQVPVPNGARVFGFIDAGRKAAGDDNFFIYSAKDRNCQRFVLDILRANGCLTPQAQAFIFQDTEKIFEDLDYLRRISNTTTDLAYLAKGLLGLGRKRGGARRKGTKDIGIF